MTDYPKQGISPAQALAKIIHSNNGSIPEHERPRAMALAEMIEQEERAMDQWCK